MIRVVIADDHNVVRQGIRVLLDKADDIEVVGEAGDGQSAIELVERLKPDVLVTDISMPRMSGTQTVERLRALSARSGISMTRLAMGWVMATDGKRESTENVTSA